MTLPGVTSETLLEWSLSWVSNPKSCSLPGPTAGHEFPDPPSTECWGFFSSQEVSLVHKSINKREGGASFQQSCHDTMNSEVTSLLGLMKSNRPVLHLDLVSRLLFINDDYVLRVGSREAAESDTSDISLPRFWALSERKQSPLKHTSPRCEVWVVNSECAPSWLWDPRLWIKHLVKKQEGIDKKWTMPLSQSGCCTYKSHHFSKGKKTEI